MRKTRQFKSLPYNKSLHELARKLRKAGILHEAVLWQQLKNKKLNGLDFDRQKIIGNFIVDFYCAEKMVVIEVDGATHDHIYLDDIERDKYLEGLGLVVIRILAKDVLQNLQGVMSYLAKHPSLS